MPDEFDIPLGFDINKIIQDADALVDKLNQINDKAKSSGKGTQKAFDDAAKSANNLNDNLKKQSTEYAKTTRSIENMKDALSDLKNMQIGEKDVAKLKFYNQEIQKLNNQIKNASNAGTKGFDEFGNKLVTSANKGTSAFQKMFSSLRFIANILPGIGIAGLLGFAIEPLIDYIKTLDILKVKLSTAVKSTAIDSSSYKSALSDITALKTSIDEFAQGTIGKKELVDRFNESIGKQVGQLKTAAEVEAFYNSKAKAYIDAMFLRAQANAALEVSTDKAAEAQKRLIEGPNFTDYAKGVVSAIGGLLGGGGFQSYQRIIQSTLLSQSEGVAKLNKDSKEAVVLFDKLKKSADAFAKANGLDFTPDKQVDTTAADNKRAATLKALYAERVQLENKFAQSQIAALENLTERAIKQEEVTSAGVLREYRNRIEELKNIAKSDPRLSGEVATQIKLINRNIEEEETQSALRIVTIKAKAAEEDVRIRRASFAEISRALKNDSQAEVDSINEKYRLILQNAKKAGTLTANLEKSLNIARVTEIDDAILKQLDKTYKEQEALSLSAIYIRKRKEGQSLKAFETANQIDILNINIEFAKKRLDLIANDPAKVLEANNLRKAIQEAQNTIDKLKSTEKIDLFEKLGLDEEKVRVVSDAVSKIGEIASGIFGGLADAASARVDAIQSEIDAIDALIEKQQEQSDAEKDLLDKGYANNYDASQKQLELSKQQRAKLLKDQEEAQKKQQDLQRAQIVADGISQVSNLITASTDIFKTFAKIPIIGIPLAIAAIAAMFGGFAIAKITAFNAVGAGNKFAEGGTIGGKSHSEGGNKYVSMDGNDRNIMEIEKGEEIIKRRSAEKHRKTLKAFNDDDFRNLSVHDISIQEMMQELGLVSMADVAKESSSNNIAMVERTKMIVVGGSSKSEDYLKSIDARLQKLEKNDSERPIVIDFEDHILLKYPGGTLTQKIKKNGG